MEVKFWVSAGQTVTQTVHVNSDEKRRVIHAAVVVCPLEQHQFDTQGCYLRGYGSWKGRLCAMQRGPRTTHTITTTHTINNQRTTNAHNYYFYKLVQCIRIYK